jgi:tetratricopeptide (TPR) repeat protein/predicted Ser/Thr protein kinase
MIAPASRKIGKYEIRNKLGRGGMADVYLAQDTGSNGLVALKLIEHSGDSDTCDSIEAERRGAELQAQLAEVDSRVVRIYDCGDADGFFYVSMEYVDGQDLAEWLRRGPVIPEFAADTAIAVAQTLEHAHTLEVSIGGKDFHGIVHGDIKPKNIRIDARGEVRVLDFGIAKALSLSRRLTRNDFGSVHYASPERLDTGEVSADSDLWSLSVMLYEMVTGAQPYHAETTERLERMIRSRIPPPPAQDPCPEPLRAILNKALAPEPELRYETARGFADDLAAYRAGKPVAAAAEDLEATRRTKRAEADATRRTEAVETRRTVKSEGDTDETRRTTPAVAAATAVAKALVAKPVRRPYHPAVKRTINIALLGLLIYSCVWGMMGYLTYRRGQQLESLIATEQLTDTGEIWTKWTELSKGNPSSVLLRGPRKAVTQKLLAAADQVFNSYRNNNTIVSVSQWQLAKEMSAHVLTLDPAEPVRGRVRLAEGHLARISGTSKRNASQLTEALEKFNQAQQLMPNSPDPQLGLARLYFSPGLWDLDKANAALHEAEKRGYSLGKREQAQLADGYRDRADRLFWDSRNVRGQDQEKTQIERARTDYQRALDLYRSVVPYGDASTRIVSIQKSLESVNFRLQEIEHGTGLTGFLRRIWR